MPLSLTNPALAYDSPPTIDSATGFPVTLPPHFKFFRRQQLAMDEANQALRAVPQGGLSVTHPEVTGSSMLEPDMPPGPLGMPGSSVAGPELSPPDLQFSGGDVQLDQPPVNLPRFLKPSFAQVSQGPGGMPAPINPGMTKFGKLLTIVRAVTMGGLEGSNEGTFGAGFQAAGDAPYRDLSRNLGAENAMLENQTQRANLAMMPWQLKQRMAAIQKAQAEAARAPFITPRGGGVFDSRTGKFLPGAGPHEPRDLVEQRRSFAEDHPDMFTDNHERNNFVLYGHEPKVATTNPNEWQLRVAAAGGDPHAQAVLDQRFSEEKTLAGIRGRTSADNRASKEQDAADAEQLASTILNAAGGDPDKALKLFDQHSGRITDPNQRRLGPSIRKAIRARRNINKPQSALDKIISGDLEGGLKDMQEPTQQP
ncbi:MAG: hypothetical protein WAQ52_07820 [Terriglobales bacterium]